MTDEAHFMHRRPPLRHKGDEGNSTGDRGNKEAQLMLLRDRNAFHGFLDALV